MISLIFTAMSGSAFCGCIVQDMEYYKYRSKEDLISDYKFYKSIYEIEKLAPMPGQEANMACYVDSYSKALMVLKKDYGLSENSQELKK